MEEGRRRRFIELLARFISLIFHPVFIPVALILAFTDITDHNLPVIILSFCFLLLIPMLSSLVYFRKKRVSNIFLIERKERIWPFIINIVCISLFTLALLLVFPEQSDIPQYFIVILLIYNVLSFIINIFWKISLHLMGIGALIGLEYLFGDPEQQIILLSILLISAIATAWARHYLKSHNLLQLAGGLIAGILVILIILNIFPVS